MSLKKKYLMSIHKTNGGRLPATYQEVEYIESNGTQYIDTGVIGQSTINVEVKAQTSDTTHDMPLIGSRGAGGYNDFLFWLHNNNSTPAQAFSYGNASAIVKNIGSIGEIYVLKNEGKQFYINGTLQGTSTQSQSFTNNTSLYLFALNYAGTIDSRKFYGKLYYCKLWQNDTLVRDFVPCYRKSDGEIGLYDLVNDQFYTNQGSGTFTKGADV